MPVKYRDRRYRLTVGKPGEQGRSWTDLRCTFDIKSDLKKSTNEAKIEIFNLGLDSRSFCEGATEIILEAGYKDTIAQIFKGDIDFLNIQKDGTEWVTQFECGDGQRLAKTPVLKSFGPGVTSQQLADGIIKEMKAEKGFVKKFANGGTEYLQGFVASAAGIDELEKIANREGYSVSIQDGQIQIIEQGGATVEEAVVLNEGSGLVGSPEIIKFKVGKGKSAREIPGLKVVAKLEPRLKPGRRVIIESRNHQGTYVIRKRHHKGDNFGGKWDTVMEVTQ